MEAPSLCLQPSDFPGTLPSLPLWKISDPGMTVPRPRQSVSGGGSPAASKQMGVPRQTLLGSRRNAGQRRPGTRGERVANRTVRDYMQCSGFWGERVSSSFSARGTTGQMCSHGQEVTCFIYKPREPNVQKCARIQTQKTADSLEASCPRPGLPVGRGVACAQDQCSGGALPCPALPSCSACLTGARTGPVTFRSRFSWRSCSLVTAKPKLPASAHFTAGKTEAGALEALVEPDSIPEPGHPPRRWAEKRGLQFLEL